MLKQVVYTVTIVLETVQYLQVKYLDSATNAPVFLGSTFHIHLFWVYAVVKASLNEARAGTISEIQHRLQAEGHCLWNGLYRATPVYPQDQSSGDV
jgi:hypothetical protein